MVRSSDITCICFLLDESGSMESIKDTLKQSIKECIHTCNEEGGECYVSLYTFSSGFENPEDILSIHLDYINCNDSGTIDFDYYPGGMTASYDAQIVAIQRLEEKMDNICILPDKIVFVTITDGEENNSLIYTSEDVKQVIHKKKSEGWQFMYLGANQDAFIAANNMGIDAQGSQNYEATDEGVSIVMRHASRAISAYVNNTTSIIDMDSGFAT